MRVLLLVLLLHSSWQHTARATVANVHGEDVGLALLPGQGLNAVDWSVKGFCVDLGRMRTQSGHRHGQYAEFRMLEIASESGITGKLEHFRGWCVEVECFFKINGRVNFARSVNKNRFSRYLLVHVRVANQMRLAKSFTFKQNAIDLLQSGRMEDFVKSCGNEFVYGRRTGGELFALFEFELHSEKHQRHFEAGIAASGLVWQAAADIENSVNAFKRLGATQIKIYRRGGQGKFPKIKSLVELGREFATIVSLLEKNFVTLELVTKDYSGSSQSTLYGRDRDVAAGSGCAAISAQPRSGY